MNDDATAQTTPATTYPLLVGSVLERLRRQSGFEQADFAAKVGVAQSTWSRIENGVSGLSVEQLADAAAVLGRRPGEILRTADNLAAALQQRGVKVVWRRQSDPLASGLMLIGGAVIGAVLVSLLAKGK